MRLWCVFFIAFSLYFAFPFTFALSFFLFFFSFFLSLHPLPPPLRVSVWVSLCLCMHGALLDGLLLLMLLPHQPPHNEACRTLLKLMDMYTGTELRGTGLNRHARIGLLLVCDAHVNMCATGSFACARGNVRMRGGAVGGGPIVMP